jgi:hypothetical protein
MRELAERLGRQGRWLRVLALLLTLSLLLQLAALLLSR